MTFSGFDVHPEADAELEAAVDRYLAYSPESARRFLAKVRKLMDELCEWPTSGRKWEPWDGEPPVYSYGVSGYPFRIVYVVRGERPVIVAYVHEKQRPGYWKSRIKV